MSASVSILMPVRNEERWLPTALKSLSRQTFPDWELIVVDDGSTDNTPDILEAAAGQDRRIRVLHHPHRGLVESLNRGLEACRAPLVARMDADDVCHPRRLDLQVRQMASHPETTLVACRVRHIPRSAIRSGYLAYEEWQNRLLDHEAIMRDLFVESPFAHPSVMFRREPIMALGGYREMGWAEDYDLWFRLAQARHRFARLPETLLYWRDRPERLSRTGRHCTPEAFRRCKLNFVRQDFLAGTSRVTLWGAGHEGKAWRSALQRCGITVERWVEADPRRIGQVVHGAPVVSRDALSPEMGKILITIGARGARSEVRRIAAEKGLVEGVDFLCVT